MSGRPTAVERARTSTRKGSSGANTRYVYCSRAGSALPNALFTGRSYSTSRQFTVDSRDTEGRPSLLAANPLGGVGARVAVLRRILLLLGGLGGLGDGLRRLGVGLRGERLDLRGRRGRGGRRGRRLGLGSL